MPSRTFFSIRETAMIAVLPFNPMGCELAKFSPFLYRHGPSLPPPPPPLHALPPHLITNSALISDSSGKKTLKVSTPISAPRTRAKADVNGNRRTRAKPTDVIAIFARAVK